jgi:hypothetical protein
MMNELRVLSNGDAERASMLVHLEASVDPSLTYTAAIERAYSRRYYEVKNQSESSL